MLCKNGTGPNLRDTKTSPDKGNHPVTRDEEWVHVVLGSGVGARSSLDELSAKHKWLRHMGEAAVVNPSKLDNLHSWMSAKLAQTHARLGLDPRNLSEPGKIRANLQDAKRIGNSLVSSVVRYKEINQLKKIMKEVRGLTKSKGLNNEAANKLFRDVIEVGQMPEKTLVYGSEAARKFNERRYGQFLKEMTQKGFTGDEIDRLVSLGVDYSDVQTMVQKAAKDLGVDIGDLEGIGYFTRVFSDDLKFLMDNHRVLGKDMDVVQEELRAGYTLFSTQFNKVRTTNHYIPEVSAQVAEFLSKDTGENVTASMLDDMLLNDPLAFRQFLHEKVSAKTLDDLVESGLMQKLPMTSSELTEYMVKQYNLPIKHLNELFVSDPLQAVEVYSKSLAEAAGQSAMFSYMNRFGIEQGWAVANSVMQSASGDSIRGVSKKDFVQIEDGFLRAAGIDPMTIRNKTLWLHKNAAEQLKALLFLSASPAMMDNFSQFIVRSGQFLRKTVLGQQAWKYTARVILGNNIAGLAGVKLDPRFMARLIPSFSDVIRVNKYGTDHLDNVKPFITIGGVDYTKKAAMEKLLQFRAVEAAPLTPGDPIGRSPIGENWQDHMKNLIGAANPQTVARAIHFAQAMRDPSANLGKQLAGGLMDVLKYEGKAFDKSIEQWLAPFTTFANVSDIATRWNMMQSLGDRTWAMAQSQDFKSWQEAMQYLDEYVATPDDSGTFTKVWGSFVRPFSLYAMFNPPAQLRHAIRYPLQYTSYHKLLALVDKAGTNSCGGATGVEGGYASYQLDGYPLTIGCDTKGQPIIFDPKNYDPIADAFVFGRESVEGLVRLGGGFIGTSSEKREQLTTDAMQQMFEQFVGESYYRGIYEILANRDTFTGRSLDSKYPGEEVSFLGVSMNKKTRHFLEQIPLLDFTNTANPGKVFGQAEMYDARGNKIREAVPALITGARRTDKDRRTDDLQFSSETQQEALKLARNVIGANIAVVDTAVNMQYTEKDIEFTLNDLKAGINKATAAYELEHFKLPEDEKRRRSDEIRKTMRYAAQLNWELVRVRKFMDENKIPRAEVFKELDKLQRKDNQRLMYQNGIPFPDVEEADEILTEYMNNLQTLEDTEGAARK